MGPPRRPSDEDLRRLLAVGRTAAVRSRGFEFLKWVRDEAGLSISAGDEGWQSIDVWKGEVIAARVYPKKAGLVKVASRASGGRDYGRGASLNARKEWVFDLDSPRFEADQLRRCLADHLP